MTVSQAIKNLRKNVLKLTQIEFAESIGVDQKTISYWENGNNIPNKSNIMTICNVFNLPNDYFKDVINVIYLPQENVNFHNNVIPGDRIEINYWSELPDELKNPKIQSVWFDREIIENAWGMRAEHLCIISMVGDKMTNYWYPIRCNDILIVDLNQNHIMGNGVYFATSQNNTRFWIREMQVLINGDTQIKGFAPSGDTAKVFSKQQLEDVDFKLIGKVIKNVSFRL